VTGPALSLKERILVGQQLCLEAPGVVPVNTGFLEAFIDDLLTAPLDEIAAVRAELKQPIPQEDPQ
jgi:hypothetical protein